MSYLYETKTKVHDQNLTNWEYTHRNQKKSSEKRSKGKQIEILYK